MTKLNLSAVEQVSDEALIDEVNRRLKSGAIDQDALAFVRAPDTVNDDAAALTKDEEAALDLNFSEAECLREAAARFARRDYPETLWNLEKALGYSFAGLGDLVLGTR